MECFFAAVMYFLATRAFNKKYLSGITLMTIHHGKNNLI